MKRLLLYSIILIGCECGNNFDSIVSKDLVDMKPTNDMSCKQCELNGKGCEQVEVCTAFNGNRNCCYRYSK